MADNILKNEFMYDEKKKEKKKLYKNWKLYASALGIIVIGLGVGLGVGLNIHHNETTTPITLINLNNLNLKKDISQTVDTQEKAFNLFIQENLTEYPDLANHIDAGTFTPSDYAVFGSLVINAKADSKYSGTITVNFLQKKQNPIDNTNLLNKTITGTEVIQNDDTGKEAFKAFLIANNSWTNLSDFVDYSSFVKPTFTTNGSLIITAKENTPYYGSLTVTITKIEQTKLSELNLNTVVEDAVKQEPTTADEAFKAFLIANNSFTNLSDFVEYSSYTAASLTAGNGSLIINAKENTKYTGTITVTIKYIVDETNLNTTFRELGLMGLYDFKVPVNTKQEDLIGIFTEKIKTLYLKSYGSFGDKIDDINIILAREYPTQNQLNTVGTVWKPSRFTASNGVTWSNLRLTIRINYKDGTYSDILVYDVETTITVVA